jgi:hypothetical protein
MLWMYDEHIARLNQGLLNPNLTLFIILWWMCITNIAEDVSEGVGSPLPKYGSPNKGLVWTKSLHHTTIEDGIS